MLNYMGIALVLSGWRSATRAGHDLLIRIRSVAACARVVRPAGASVVSVIPVMRPFSTAQVMASNAQSLIWSASV